jgi:hypothetical protein
MKEPFFYACPVCAVVYYPVFHPNERLPNPPTTRVTRVAEEQYLCSPCNATMIPVSFALRRS